MDKEALETTKLVVTELQQGIIRNMPTHRIPAGAFFDVRGFRASDTGLESINGFNKLDSGVETETLNEVVVTSFGLGPSDDATTILSTVFDEAISTGSTSFGLLGGQDVEIPVDPALLSALGLNDTTTYGRIIDAFLFPLARNEWNTVIVTDKAFLRLGNKIADNEYNRYIRFISTTANLITPGDPTFPYFSGTPGAPLMTLYLADATIPSWIQPGDTLVFGIFSQRFSSTVSSYDLATSTITVFWNSTMDALIGNQLTACALFWTHTNQVDYTNFRGVLYTTTTGQRGYLKLEYAADTSQFVPVDYRLAPGSEDPSFDNYTMGNFRTMTTHRGRLIFGGVTEGNVTYPIQYYPTRIRWTEPTDPERIPIVNYLDLDEFGDEIMRIRPLGEGLLVYLKNSIYVGRPSTLKGLPWVFTKVPTNGSGIVGPRAWAPINNGNLHVAADGVWLFGLDGSFKSVGDAVFRSITKTRNKEWLPSQTTVTPYPGFECVIFTFFFKTQGADLGETWLLNYKTGAWTQMFQIPTATAFANAGLIERYTYAGIDQTYEFDNSPLSPISFDSVSDTISDKTLFLFSINKIYLYNMENYLTAIGADTPIYRILRSFETGDIEFDRPAQDKVVTEITLKLDTVVGRDILSNPTQEHLSFSTEVSNDRGQTWRPAGRLMIPMGKSEGKINFRITGSMFRVRCSTDTPLPVYTVVEIGYRVRLRNMETRYMG